MRKKIQELKVECKKIIWTNKRELLRKSAVVISASIMIGIYIMALDSGYQTLINVILQQLK